MLRLAHLSPPIGMGDGCHLDGYQTSVSTTTSHASHLLSSHTNTSKPADGPPTPWLSLPKDNAITQHCWTRNRVVNHTIDKSWASTTNDDWNWGGTFQEKHSLRQHSTKIHTPRNNNTESTSATLDPSWIIVKAPLKHNGSPCNRQKQEPPHQGVCENQ